MGRDIIGAHGSDDAVVPGPGQVPGGLVDNVLVDIHGGDAALFAGDMGQDGRVVAGTRTYFQHP